MLYNNITYAIDPDFKERKKSYRTLLMCSFSFKRRIKVHINIKSMFSIKLDDDVYSVFFLEILSANSKLI